MTDADSTAGGDPDADAPSGVAARLESILAETLADREAAAFVHAGTARDPDLRYCLYALEGRSNAAVADERTVVAVAFDGDEWLVERSDATAAHPAPALADRLVERIGAGDEAGTVLTPPNVPHDAALYLENAGFDLKSTAALERARSAKAAGERDRIADAQAAAGAGIRRAAALLADATVADGRLATEEGPVTPERLRRAVDAAVVEAGAFPAGDTVVNPDPGHVPSTIGDESAGGDRESTADEPLRPGEPIVLAVAPRGPDGYRGGLVRTLVVDGDGGRERRAHVGATQSFRSAAAMLTADAESVTAVEADLEAEVRAFGFEEPDAVRTRVSGVGLEPRERPMAGGDEIGPGSVVRLESAVRIDDGRWLRIADLLVKGEAGERAAYLEAPSRSLDPAALLEQ